MKLRHRGQGIERIGIDDQRHVVLPNQAHYDLALWLVGAEPGADRDAVIFLKKLVKQGRHSTRTQVALLVHRQGEAGRRWGDRE